MLKYIRKAFSEGMFIKTYETGREFFQSNWKKSKIITLSLHAPSQAITKKMNINYVIVRTYSSSLLHAISRPLWKYYQTS